MGLLIKKIVILFFLLSSGISLAQDQNSLLDEEDQSTICIVTVNSLEGLDICINEKINPVRLAVCTEYSSSVISETLCLKNRELKTQTIVDCFLTETTLEEQICLLYPDSYDSILTRVYDLETFSTSIEPIKNTMEEALGFNISFNMLDFNFEFLENNLEEDNILLQSMPFQTDSD